MGLTSDIIGACQWIIDHKAQYNIRVANLSFQSEITAPFYIDPLDRAVEQLWFNGIVVVVAAGNYGSADGPSGVTYSPANDPFVITVGAADLNGSTDPNKATMAPWSAWGSTIDGFAKPELSAPGRYMIGAVPQGSTLVSERPGSVTSPGYMQLSGTSFAAPVVSGAAATIIAQHPNFTPDQVKGALMLTARGLAKSVGDAGGVGLVQAGDAIRTNDPPNPNAGLAPFLAPSTGTGGSTTSFDSASWHSAAQSDASWNSASWNSASWHSASWNSASWHSASWNSASWNSASWHSASWNSASWNSASWHSASWHSGANEDAADDDVAPSSSVMLSATQVAALLAELAR
jgi:serine protease AprX